MKDIRALVFDFGGTLDGNGIHWLERAYQFIHERHPEITREAFDAADKAAITEFALGDLFALSGLIKTVPCCRWVRSPLNMRRVVALRETTEAIAVGIYKRLGLGEKMKDGVR